MSRMSIAAAAVAATAALLFASTAAAAPIKLVGKVGPGHTITLTLGGKKVKRLKAGKTYRIVVSDRSSDHDFRLVGPGVNKVITGEEFTGTRTAVVKLRKGSYRFYCAPHADEMRGGFSAT